MAKAKGRHISRLSFAALCCLAFRKEFPFDDYRQRTHQSTSEYISKRGRIEIPVVLIHLNPKWMKTDTLFGLPISPVAISTLFLYL